MILSSRRHTGINMVERHFSPRLSFSHGVNKEIAHPCEYKHVTISRSFARVMSSVCTSQAADPGTTQLRVPKRLISSFNFFFALCSCSQLINVSAYWRAIMIC